MTRLNWGTLSGGRGQLPRERDADSVGRVDPPIESTHPQIRPVPKNTSVVAVVRQTGKMMPDRFPTWLERLAAAHLTPRLREIRGQVRVLLPRPVDGGNLMVAGDPPVFLAVVGAERIDLVRLRACRLPASLDELRRWTLYTAPTGKFNILAVRSLLAKVRAGVAAGRGRPNRRR